jgi:branched-chain amino acid transport system permease protein
LIRWRAANCASNDPRGAPRFPARCARCLDDRVGDRYNRRTQRRGGSALDIALQLILNGLAVGCIYGLVALGFVLIYKATELVNFAQGDLMMLGAFVCYMLVVWYGWGYWTAFAVAVAAVALFGAGLDAGILRRVLGQPQFAVVMLTIGLGAIFRSFASITWGTEIYTLPTPFSARATRIAGVTVSHEYVAIIVGTILLCAVLYAFFTWTRVGVAMQAASQNQLAAYYMGIPVKRMFSLIWAISAGVAAIAGVLLAPVSLIDINLGFIGLKAFAAAVLGGFGSIPGALVGGLTIGLIELWSGAYLPQGFKDVAAYVVLLLVLAVRPQGMFGTVGRKKV